MALFVGDNIPALPRSSAGRRGKKEWNYAVRSAAWGKGTKPNRAERFLYAFRSVAPLVETSGAAFTKRIPYKYSVNVEA